MKTLKVAHGVQRRDSSHIKDYKVINVKNSTAYHPGEILNKDEVQRLCESTDWDVVILPLESKR